MPGNTSSPGGRNRALQKRAMTQFRNLFLFVCGRTPQIVTETLFFFVVRRRPPVRPDEIHILTTTEGQTLILEQLLRPETGQFVRFCQEYGLDRREILFSPDTVQVLTNRRGVPLKDIRTDADNRAAADQIVARVRALTSDPRTRLFASLAGGRKTMGLYLGLALQFYGRPQDRLTHVLVSPPELENNPAFFYPPARCRTFPTAQGAVASRAVTVTVAEVPLILLGHKLPVLRDRAALSYVELVAQSQQEVDLLTAALPVRVERLGRQLRVGSTLIRLSGLEFVLYWFVARRRQGGACEPECAGCAACTVGTADFCEPQTIEVLTALATETGIRDPRLHELQWWANEGSGAQRFLQVCARIKQKVRAALGEASRLYVIAPLQVRQGRTARYTIALPKALLRCS